MRLVHLIFAIITVEAKIIGKYCDIAGDDPTKQCFVKEILISMTHSPNQLAVDRYSNTLYFSFDSGHGEYMPALYKIGTKELTVLKGVKDAFAVAFDSDNREVYFGGTHGIYRYDTVLKSLKRLNIENLDIWWLHVKKNVYFVKFPSLNTYYYENGSIKAIMDLNNNAVHQMVIDMDDNKIFINNTGLYGIKANGHEAMLLKNSPRFLNMVTDNERNVYVCSEDGIYIVSKIVQKVKKIINIHGVLGFTFDQSNNIIYSDSHEIVRLASVSNTEKAIVW